ncbi:MAG: hypothetical protein AAF378_25110 [Cyanobacteria bacterium P01_A01_bin.84]
MEYGELIAKNLQRSYEPSLLGFQEECLIAFKRLGEENDFFKGITALMTDSLDLVTTEGLGILLSECLLRSNNMAQKQWFYPSLKNPVIMQYLSGIDSCVYQQMLRQAEEFMEERLIEDSQNLSWTVGLAVYNSIRSNIHQLQEELGISGIYRCDSNYRGVRHISFVKESQLVLSESDLEVLKNFAPKVANHFCYLGQITSPKYLLVRIDRNGEAELATTYRQIRGIATNAKYAVLSHQTLRNVGTHSEEEPDVIELSLILSWNGESSDTVNFRLYHPDLAYYLWLENNKEVLIYG